MEKRPIVKYYDLVETLLQHNSLKQARKKAQEYMLYAYGNDLLNNDNFWDYVGDVLIKIKE